MSSRTIDEFIKAQKRTSCPVCAIPLEVRRAMTDARRKRYKIQTILDWIKSEHGIKLTPEQVRNHYAGQHDGKAGVGR